MTVNTAELVQRFSSVFPDASPTLLVRSPGRVNLIGEHVDYADGFVLPIAMSQALYVVVAPTNDGTLAVHTTAGDQTIRFPAADPGPPAEVKWGNYVRGTVEMLRREGITCKGGRLFIHSEVPLGGGVSSSAALEVGTANAILALAGRTMEPVKTALLARQAEHQYAKSPCGIMDQFICALGREGHALLLDCRTQKVEHLPMALGDTVLVVMNTQVKHEVGASQYPVRQKQIAEGLAILKTAQPGLASLRDVTPELLEANRTKMDSVVYRRCRHIVSEIQRTAHAGEVLRANDAAGFGKLMVASHVSLRDDYEVSCEELDALVDLATGIPGVYGARMTGAGFGGCAIALVAREAEERLEAAIRQRYDSRFKDPAIVYTTTASNGAAVQKL